jgi:hypothetical protein
MRGGASRRAFFSPEEVIIHGGYQSPQIFMKMHHFCLCFVYHLWVTLAF